MPYVQNAPNMMIAPDLAAQQQQLQRQQQIADLLRSQAMQSPDPMQTAAGGVAVKQSPLQGVARLLTAYMAGKKQDDIDAKGLDIAKNYQGKLAALLGGDGGMSAAQSGGIPSVSADGSPAPATSAPVPSKGVNLAKYLRGMAVGSMYGDDAAKAYYADEARTETQKNNDAYGIPSADVQAGMMRELAAKGQQNLRAGSTITKTNPDGSISPVFTAPDMHSGTNLVWDKGAPSAMQIPGVNKIVADRAAAELFGKNTQTLAPPDQLIANPDGTRQPATIGGAIQSIGQPQTSAPPGFPSISPIEQRKRDADAVQLVQGEAAQSKDPATLQNAADMQARLNAGQSVVTGSAKAPRGIGAPFGQQQGAEAAQSELSKKWMAQNDANQQAQTTTSYLQNIRSLSDKAATGPMSDKIALVNGLLSLVGNEKATDAVTANNLMDKYSNQITARLGSGGMATDAGRAIIAAAYPNSKMNSAAIHDAVDNLVGANEMTKARTMVLAPHATGRDPVAYSQREIAFDQAADPRIWQWKNITDPAKRKAFAASVMKQDPSFPQRIDALEQMGALK